MESKHAMVDKAASIHTAEGFFDAYRKRDLDKMVAQQCEFHLTTITQNIWGVRNVQK
jgi:hypothetical protein